MGRIVLSMTTAFWLFSTNALATEYIYRDIMANTLPSAKCAAKDEAIASATKAYNMDRFTKKFCQTQGYGWHVDSIKDQGTPECNSCSDKGEQRCYVKDVVVTCRLIKPGSVGMLPGKG